MLETPEQQEQREAPVRDADEEQGWRFVFPRRKRTWPAALFLIPFGLVFAGGPAAMAVGAIGAMARGEGALVLIMIPFALPFLVIGLGVMLLGIACLHSALTVEVTPDELRASRDKRVVAFIEAEHGALDEDAPLAFAAPGVPA